ncbi:hypothetical protein NM75_01605 [Dickeya fangzhongdai]|nr:hypothetical protein NM75_01605 [Dickeya fangzhongdai]
MESEDAAVTTARSLTGSAGITAGATATGVALAAVTGSSAGEVAVFAESSRTAWAENDVTCMPVTLSPARPACSSCCS